MEKPPVFGAIIPSPAEHERDSDEVGGFAQTSLPPRLSHSPLESSPEPAGVRRLGNPSSVVVRGVRPTDLGNLRRIGSVMRLDQPDSLLAPYSPLRVALRTSLPVFAGQPLFVASVGDTLVGFAHFRLVSPDQRWVFHALGSATGVYGAEPVWEELIGHGIVAAGLSGVKRLFARVPQGSPLAASMKLLAWSPYASETVVVAQALRPRRGPTRFRAQELADTWAIHQLYNAAVPRQVQYAEAFTSHRWEVGSSDRRRAGAGVTGWLIEEGYHVIGYARLASRDGSHVLECVCHPERLEVLGDLIDGALAHITAQPQKRVYAVVRHYQQEALTALVDRGFTPMLEQDLHVKYTTVSLRSAASDTIPFHIDVMEKLPKRVPSFLHGHPSDESVT